MAKYTLILHETVKNNVKYKVWVHIEEKYEDEFGEEIHQDLYEEEYRMLRDFDTLEDANEYIKDLYEEQKNID